MLGCRTFWPQTFRLPRFRPWPDTPMDVLATENNQGGRFGYIIFFVNVPMIYCEI